MVSPRHGAQIILAHCYKCGLDHSLADLAIMEPLKNGAAVPSGDEGTDLVMFNCSCGSTFSIRVPAGVRSGRST